MSRLKVGGAWGLMSKSKHCCRSLAAAFCGVRLKAAVFDESTPFHATLEELANDRERLLP